MPIATPSLTPPRPLPRSLSALASSVPTYPRDFPIADREPYSYAVDMGVIRSEMSAGNSRQRRAYRLMPHAFGLSFHMRVEELFGWQAWINAFGYSWFLCPVSTMYAGAPPDPGNLRLEVLRFTGNLAVQEEGFDWLAVTVAAELAPDAFADLVPIGLGDWIIGGTPAAPSAATWYVGGTPSAPSSDTVSGGSPAFPASYA